jgi:hypothetical protein
MSAGVLWQAAEKTTLRGVILSKAKDLLFVRVESKADPSDAQNRRDLRMTLLQDFQQPPGFGIHHPWFCFSRRAYSLACSLTSEAGFHSSILVPA